MCAPSDRERGTYAGPRSAALDESDSRHSGRTPACPVRLSAWPWDSPVLRLTFTSYVPRPSSLHVLLSARPSPAEHAGNVGSGQIGMRDVQHERGAFGCAILPDLVFKRVIKHE